MCCLACSLFCLSRDFHMLVKEKAYDFVGGV